MNRLLVAIKSPLFWFALILAYQTINNNLLDGEFKNVIRSDGRGYYAYLPALFLYNDPTFSASLEAETTNATPNFNQYYLYETQTGERYNKYFPGIALLQAPFFGLGCLAAKVSGASIDGYSEPFEFAFLLGSLFYSVLGLWLLHLCIQLRFPKLRSEAPWLTILIYGASTLFMYNTYTLGLSHHYSFFLFTLFAWCILKFRSNTQLKFAIAAGLTLGLIALVRPTNILVVLAVPILLKDTSELKMFLQALIARRGRIVLSAFASFLLLFSLLFFIWKWQSGQWVTWSYSGEGFNFFKPAFIENLFGFRNGLFVHSPIILVSAISALVLIRKEKSWLLFWWLYFLLNTWIISSWWCWDYETSFGNRPFTEHTFFLLFPLLTLMSKKLKWLWFSLGTFALLGLIRYTTYVNGYMIDQRFTAKNYVQSLAFWKEENFDRWRYGRSVVPFGKRIEEDILVYHQPIIDVKARQTFIQTASKNLSPHRTNERYYFRVWLEKKSTSPLNHVYLVVHATDDDSDFMHYHAIPLYNDRLEGVGRWGEVSLSGQIPDHFNDFEHVKMYIWNQGKEAFQLRNVQMYIDTYKS
jgi:hypothetical protein